MAAYPAPGRGGLWQSWSVRHEGVDAFDFVIVGAGSAGCVLAARLSENPAVRVLLLEAGPKDHHPLIRVPAAFPKLYDSKLDWGYRTVAQTALGGRQIFWPRGRVLGGSSAINAMMWVRGIPADYDRWAEVAGSNWSYAALLPYFLRLEDHVELDIPDSIHGTDGPLPVSKQRDPNELTLAWLQAADELGIGALAPTLLGPETGVSLVEVNQRRGQRVSAAAAYLQPIRGRPNLVIRTNATTERILIERGIATGVAYRIGRTRLEVSATKEVLLAAGALNSPQLLMCSGIGPAAVLRGLGIDVVYDAPAVGQNLRDHLTAGIALGIKRPVSLANAQSIRAGLTYFATRRGPLSSNICEGFGFVKSDAHLDLPDLELLFVPSLFVNEGLKLTRKHGMTIAAVLLQPESTGEVTIVSNDPSIAPRIDPRYLSDREGQDALRLRIGIERCIEFSRAPSLAREITELVQPPGPLGDETAEASLRDFAQTLYHPVGTCRMGLDVDSVVNEELRVRGIGHLRVIDASVFPTIPRAHTHAPTVVLAERASDLIQA